MILVGKMFRIYDTNGEKEGGSNVLSFRLIFKHIMDLSCKKISSREKKCSWLDMEMR